MQYEAKSEYVQMANVNSKGERREYFGGSRNPATEHSLLHRWVEMFSPNILRITYNPVPFFSAFCKALSFHCTCQELFLLLDKRIQQDLWIQASWKAFCLVLCIQLLREIPHSQVDCLLATLFAVLTDRLYCEMVFLRTLLQTAI